MEQAVGPKLMLLLYCNCVYVLALCTCLHRW